VTNAEMEVEIFESNIIFAFPLGRLAVHKCHTSALTKDLM